ncbi:MAG: hypothetical protein ABIP94_11135 [Planctomycetota bacterium]
MLSAAAVAQAPEVEAAIATLCNSTEGERQAKATAILQANTAAAAPPLIDVIGMNENARPLLCRTLVALDDSALPA